MYIPALSIFSLSEFFSQLLPIMLFVLVFAALLFLMYLRTMLDRFFRSIDSIAANLAHIAEKLPTKDR